MPEKLTLITTDQVMIVGNYYPASNVKAPAVILLHMMPATKESWDEFAKKLQQAGFQVLAIDERGHGESIKKGQDGEGFILDYKKFSLEDHQAKKLDVEACREFFIEKEVSMGDIFMGGASIGANLAIQYLAEHPEARAAFALSPGLDFGGIETVPLVQVLQATQSLFLIAAKDDAISAYAVGQLSDQGAAKKRVELYEKGGHGTNLFFTNPDLMDELVSWLRNF
ncbi:MAG: alpha/beta fold hydrolase [Candidatus Spechtbacteria bacterium]|nr:alpha/beta fold hydrolase [Candidatus Spechtbacteria bacterium]